MILLVDGPDIFRAVFEMANTKSPVTKVGAVAKACAGTVRRAIKAESPTHVALALDCDGPSWRNDLYEDYLTHSSRPPDAYFECIALASNILQDEGVVIMQKARMEADDIIGSMATQLSESGMPCIILSNSKNYLQLVSDTTHIKHHFKNEYRDAGYVLSHYEISPAQFRSYLALAGNGTKRIPHAPGIGHKTAIDLIHTHGFLDNILEHSELVMGKAGKIIEQHKDQITLSYELFSIKNDLKLDKVLTPLNTKKSGQHASE